MNGQMDGRTERGMDEWTDGQRERTKYWKSYNYISLHYYTFTTSNSLACCSAMVFSWDRDSEGEETAPVTTHVHPYQQICSKELHKAIPFSLMLKHWDKADMGSLQLQMKINPLIPACRREGHGSAPKWMYTDLSPLSFVPSIYPVTHQFPPQVCQLGSTVQGSAEDCQHGYFWWLTYISSALYNPWIVWCTIP